MQNNEEEIDSEENLQRNLNRVDYQCIVPDTQEEMVPDSQDSQALSDIVQRNKETSKNQEERTNVFKMLELMQSSLNDLHQKMDQNKVFRIEGQTKRDINALARRNFGNNIFEVTASCKTDVRDFIEEEMGRPPKPTELRGAISYIQRKYTTEHRPTIHKKMKATMNKSIETQARSLFKGFVDPCAEVATSEYRKKIVLVMRFVHRQVADKSFWKKVKEMYMQIESEESGRKMMVYKRLREREQ